MHRICFGKYVIPNRLWRKPYSITCFFVLLLTDPSGGWYNQYKQKMLKKGENMRNALVFIGLVILSVLYLFEVDYAKISWMNVAAFLIIALTLLPLIWKMLSGLVKKIRSRKEKDGIDEQQGE